MEQELLILGSWTVLLLMLSFHRMVQLLKSGDKPYVDLTVSFSCEKDEDIPGPPIRYIFT